MQLIVAALGKWHAQQAGLVSKQWRAVFATLALHKLRVLLAATRCENNSSSTSAKIGKWRQFRRMLQRSSPKAHIPWLGVLKLIKAACPGLQLELLLTEKHWPSSAQLQHALDAVSQHHNIHSLHISVLEQLALLDAKHSSSLVTIISTVCSALAANASHIKDLKLTTGSIQAEHHASITRSLTHLPSLTHLSYNSSTLQLHHLSPITSALTSLTSLHLDLSGSTVQLPAALLQLAALLHLASLHLTTSDETSLDGPLLLPDWPALQHLHLLTSDSSHYNIQLSEHHASQLESLSCCQFHTVGDVTSLDSIKQLHLAFPPALPHPLGPPMVVQHLSLPLLERLRFMANCSSYFKGNRTGLQRALVFAQQAPNLQLLDLSELDQKVGEDVRDPQQRLVQLLTKDVPLRGLKLPLLFRVEADVARPGAQPALAQQTQEPVQKQLQQLRRQESDLARSSSLLREQQRLLCCLSGLQELQLSCSSTDVLLKLPAELTALTVADVRGVGMRTWQMQQRQEKGPALRQLRSLCVTYSQEALQQVLQMASGVTSLTVGEMVPQGLEGVKAAGTALSQLEQLRCRPWAGMASELAGLRRLRSLSLIIDQEVVDVLALEQQAQQLKGLTQLSELVLVQQCRAARLLRVAQQLAGAMGSRCLVRLEPVVWQSE